MAGRDATQLSKLGQFLRRHTFIARQMEHGVLQGTGVAITQYESITIVPFGCRRCILHDFRPKQVRHGGTSHGGTRVSTLSRLGLIRTDGTNRVDTFQFQRRAFVMLFQRHDGVGCSRGVLFGVCGDGWWCESVVSDTTTAWLFDEDGRFVRRRRRRR